MKLLRPITNVSDNPLFDRWEVTALELVAALPVEQREEARFRFYERAGAAQFDGGAAQQVAQRLAVSELVAWARTLPKAPKPRRGIHAILAGAKS